MNAQEIFDHVVTFLRKQGRPSKVGLNCLYRGPEGTMCAVGCLLDDSEYTPKMEEVAVYYLKARGLLPERLQDHVSLLAGLQDAHDYGDWTDGLPSDFRDVAQRHNLDTGALDS